MVEERSGGEAGDIGGGRMREGGEIHVEKRREKRTGRREAHEGGKWRGGRERW